MKVVVMGAGIIGVSTAWYLLDKGHEVTVVDREPDAALETSFANGSQISVSFCEPWANAGAPLKVLKWLARDDAPLLFRPKLDPHQWMWGLKFLGQCTNAAFERNVAQLVSLGRYSHDSLKSLVAATSIEYERLERGILHFFVTQEDVDLGAAAADIMRKHGVARRVLTRAETLKIEPALTAYGDKIAGGIFTPSDESGDARVFTQKLALQCVARGARFLFNHDIAGIAAGSSAVQDVQVTDRVTGQRTSLHADAYVAALGPYTAPMLRTVGVNLDIYPAKGYSATLKLKHPERASFVSLMDDSRKIAISRLGDTIRIAGTAELAGYDTTLDSKTSRVRCESLIKRYEEVFPGVADLSQPNYWTGLRPSTPTNIPYIGRSRISNLWVNAGHGTLGWTHGAGSGRALAELMSGKQPAMDFDFYGQSAGKSRPRAAMA
ncbi:MAG: amino acid dehydrogenase [Rhizobacter sp.]|nr:amino acid dehydrogenase [Rhizobacter sp.]